jgi:glucosylceramidase
MIQTQGVDVVVDQRNVSSRLSTTVDVFVTSEAGDRLARKPNVSFRDGRGSGPRVVVRPEVTKQAVTGIGTSFTESSAFVLAHLEPAKRRQVMERIYGEDGANFSMARTPIGATDFSVEGKYSYAEIPGDSELAHFSIDPDRDGFRAARYSGVKDESFDVLPMIKEALAIKAAQSDSSLRIVASAWTAPPWMKDIEDWYVPMSPANDYRGTGGSLKPEHTKTYANYLVRYLDAYAAEGVPIWGLTPVNEPEGNNGQWESMHFTPETQSAFIRDDLGPALRASGHGDVRVLVYDQNRDQLEKWANVILADRKTRDFVYGMAIHWYASTFKVFEDVLDRVHAQFPGFSLIHTEGCIDDLGKPAGEGILDPDGFEESGWFDDDAFWWNDHATDWAYTATWAPNSEDHPMYTPVHRYARNIIESLNHWVEGWIDWNIVLDQRGGPNHVGNFCGAPIMIDVERGYVYYTPVFHVLAQLSKTIRPGDHVVEVATELDELGEDAIHATATKSQDGVLTVQVLNTTKQPLEFSLEVGDRFAPVMVPANALQTLRVEL